MEQILHPTRGEWPTYNGSLSANRHSALTQIDTQNVSRLKLEWTYTLPLVGLQTTPLVSEGVMYVSGPNRVCALDSRTGREIWCYSRPRNTGGTIPGDAAKGANRGVALLGDRVFLATDDAHLICLNRLTGGMHPGKLSGSLAGKPSTSTPSEIPSQSLSVRSGLVPRSCSKPSITPSPFSPAPTRSTGAGCRSVSVTIGRTGRRLSRPA